jgi:peptidoglycan/LPS O-acetylase OafA/YrhL
MTPGWFTGETVEAAMARGVNRFGLMRLLLALAVVVSHAFSVASGQVLDEPLARLTGFTLGEHAVNGFFAISGFLVTMSYERRGWRDYVLARSLRIVPGLVAATLVVALLFGLALTTLGAAGYLSDPKTARFIIATLTTFKSNIALPGVFATNPFTFPMGTVWTLKYEVICYGGVLALGLAGLLRQRHLLLGAALVLVIIIIGREMVAPHGPKGIETALRLPLIFLCGGLAWLWRAVLPVSLAGAVLALVPMTLLLATPLAKPVLYLGTAYLVLALALAPQIAALTPEPKDDLSYGTYLYGWPVQQALVALFPAAGVWVLLGPALALTLLIAAASWWIVEQPAMRLKRRWLSGGVS